MSSDSPLPKKWLLSALEIEMDSEAGPSEQVRRVLGALREAAQELLTSEAPPGDVQRRLGAYAERLRRAAPDLLLIHHWLAGAMARLDQGAMAVSDDVAHALEELERITAEVVRAAEALFPPGQRVVTLGHSETVLAMLQAYGDRLEAITVSEGRPRATGAKLAREVAAYGLPVRLITEAQLELYLPDISVAVVSARGILPDGTAVARVGSSVLARLCAAHAIPFYVAADHTRWVDAREKGGRFVRIRRSPGEVLADAPSGVLVSNVAFDPTPPSLITGYVTETGIRRGATSRSAPAPTGAEPALV